MLGPTERRSDIVLAPRTFLQKALWGKATVSQELLLLPRLREAGEFRLRSETALTSPLNEQLSLKLSLIDAYDSAPVSDAERNDLRLMSSLAYAF